MTVDIIIPVSPSNEPSNKPTSSHVPTIVRTDKPTNRDCPFRTKFKCKKQGCAWKSVGDDAGKCIMCSTVNGPSLCKNYGCVFTNKPRPGAHTCSACYESLNRSKCLDNGCVWEGKANDGACKSCKQFRVKSVCISGGCAFKLSETVNEKGRCFACNQIRTSKKCTQQEESCVWNIQKGECSRK